MKTTRLGSFLAAISPSLALPILIANRHPHWEISILMLFGVASLYDLLIRTYSKGTIDVRGRSWSFYALALIISIVFLTWTPYWYALPLLTVLAGLIDWRIPATYQRWIFISKRIE